MFWTAFIWGLGATLGGSFGLMFYIVLHDIWAKFAKSKALIRANELAELANVALMRRNELTEIQISHLETIASSLEQLELSNRK